MSANHPYLQPVKGASGSRQMFMNDPGAQQPSQMFLTWAKARPQHWELRTLLLTNSVRVLWRPTVIYNKGCGMGPPAYSPYPRRLESLTIQLLHALTHSEGQHTSCKLQTQPNRSLNDPTTCTDYCSREPKIIWGNNKSNCYSLVQVHVSWRWGVRSLILITVLHTTL